MDWIIDNLIAIGSARETVDPVMLRQAGIHSVLNLDGSLTKDKAGAMGLDVLISIALIDGPGNVPARYLAAVDAVGRLATMHPALLICCHAGKSRSAIVLIGHLIRTHGLTFDQARNMIEAKRSVQITPGIERVLRFL